MSALIPGSFGGFGAGMPMGGFGTTTGFGGFGGAGMGMPMGGMPMGGFGSYGGMGTTAFQQRLHRCARCMACSQSYAGFIRQKMQRWLS